MAPSSTGLAAQPLERWLHLGRGEFLTVPPPPVSSELKAQVRARVRHLYPLAHHTVELHWYTTVDALDSSSMHYPHWCLLARTIASAYADYDGFIIVHGTDTMAYSASALSFMLSGLAKPVVLTGSQIPAVEPGSDAWDNLHGAIASAACPDLPETLIAFGGKILRGCRASKVSASSLDCFDSPNYPLLGTFSQTQLTMNREAVLRMPQAPLLVEANWDTRIADFRLFPGLTSTAKSFWEAQFSPGSPVRGMLLHTFGAGNLPDNVVMQEHLAGFMAAGRLVVVLTQCRRGRVDLSRYASAHSLMAARAVSGADMTVEAAQAKLMWVLGHVSPTRWKQVMESNQRGEFTEARSQRDFY